MIGQIISVSCGVYSVKCDDSVYLAKPRGSLKSKVGRLLVGDFVDVNIDDGIIVDVSPRKSSLIRPAIANIDQIVIVLSYAKPEFSYELAFKYLTYANMNNIPAKLIVTKIDLCEKNDELNEIKTLFEKLKIETFFVSNKKHEGLEKVDDLFKGKISCLMGQSGVGKSSLLNELDVDYKRNIGEYSKALGRGKHETKEVVLLPYKNGYIADTPGFSSLELNLFKEDLAQYFPGFESFTECYFSNCLHISEKNCSIKNKVEKGEIPQKAYEIYLKLSNFLINKNQRY